MLWWTNLSMCLWVNLWRANKLVAIVERLSLLFTPKVIWTHDPGFLMFSINDGDSLVFSTPHYFLESDWRIYYKKVCRLIFIQMSTRMFFVIKIELIVFKMWKPRWKTPWCPFWHSTFSTHSTIWIHYFYLFLHSFSHDIK